jgi:hypothetical protein
MREGRKYDSQHLYYNGVIDTLKEVRRSFARPIRLADVLLAIAGKGRGTQDYSGEFFICQFDENNRLHRVPYTLRTDDLEQQSDETIAFIASLLIPEPGDGG